MRAGEASQTAIGAAMHRAAHQVVDAPRLFDDPFAVTILGMEPQQIRDHAIAARSGMRSHIVGRSLFAEETLDKAIARGVRQYVLLGAGLDTFALRNPHTGIGLKIFEVDNPDTQAMKRRRLEALGVAAPEPVIYTPVDFEKDTLADGLSRVGFDLTQPAVFAWLGVTVYLTREAVMTTLAAVAALAPGTEIVFDYGHRRDDIPLMAKVAHATWKAGLAAMGEPIISYFEPEALANDLRVMGFSELEDLTASDVKARYFTDHLLGLPSYAGSHLMRARV